MASPRLFTFRQLPMLADMLEERGVAIADVLRDAGFAEVSRGAEITAPLAKVQRLLELVAARLDAPLFGVDLADRLPPGTFGVTEFVVQTSPTIRHALSAACELSPLINPGLDMRYIADDLGCEVRFCYADLPDGLGEILNEYTVAYLAKQFSVVLGRSLPLSRAWFAHDRKQDREQLARRLGCSVAFEAADCGLAVASEVIDQTIPHSNEALYSFLLGQGRTQLSNLGKHDVVAQVIRAIEARIAEPRLGAEVIARALAISQRSMQRQLAEAGTSYRNVVALVRRRRREELVRSGLPEADIATRLGFANVQSMRRSLDDHGDDPSGSDAE